MVVLFLVPYLGLSGALQPLTPIIATQLHASEQTIGIGYGLANAGYAVGTILAVQLAQHLPQRRLTVIYAGLLVVGSVLAASATGPAMFIVGHVLQGLCTSLLLIASTPPLILGYPVAKLRSTAVVFNLCIFGAVAAGPLIGGAQASFHAWRPLFWIVAGIALAGLVMSLLTFSDAPPADLSAPRDPIAIGLAATGSVAAFFGAAELLTHGFLDPIAVIPLLVGVALIAALIVYEYRARHPLLILRNLVTTIPMTGVVVAICAAAAATSAIALTATVQAPHYTPLHLGLLYIPELAAAVLTAIVFGVVFSTRFIHYYALAGMVILAAGILVLRAVIPPGSALTLVGSALVGIGIGASVVPALFLAGYSLRSASIQRVFAILELLRAIAAFLIAPILLHFAVTATGLPSAAMDTALWICFGLSAGGAIVGVLLYTLGRVRPMAPALERWMGGMEPAWESPPLLAALRPGAPLPTLAAAAAAAALSGGGRLVTASAGLPGLSGLSGRRAVREREAVGPVLFAYDGSRLAQRAIAEAGRQLPAGRDALVLTVWRTFNVGFIPEPGAQFDAACADAVGEAAEQTAAHGAALAQAAGFTAQPLAVQGTPAAKAVADAADDHDASLIVLGAHRRTGLGGRVAGSVAAEVASHSERPVMIVHGGAGDEAALARRGGVSGALPGRRVLLSLTLTLRLASVGVMAEILRRRVVRAQASVVRAQAGCAGWVQVDRVDDLDPGHAHGHDRRLDYADLAAGHLPRDRHRPAPAGQQLLPAVDDPRVPGGHERAGDHAWPAGRYLRPGPDVQPRVRRLHVLLAAAHRDLDVRQRRGDLAHRLAALPGRRRGDADGELGCCLDRCLPPQ
jgi:nucleotide-binding universal stress UspA family protein/MFS family permease